MDEKQNGHLTIKDLDECVEKITSWSEAFGPRDERLKKLTEEIERGTRVIEGLKEIILWRKPHIEIMKEALERIIEHDDDVENPSIVTFYNCIRIARQALEKVRQ